MVGTAAGGFGRQITAETRTYTDANNGIQTIAQHARIEGLHPDTAYVYRIVSDGETQVSGAFRTGPEGRAPFRFTSVGDIACGDTAFSKASLNAAATAASVELFDPVVHLVNGDLSYANSNQLSQPQVWAEYFNNTQLSAANRPWMPTLGNHENEPGNGPQGYLSYQTRFTLPQNHSSDFEGNWYKFQIGSVLFVMLDNNDVCYQVDTGTYLSTGDNQILTGYSGGAQERWLEKTLHQASTDNSVDWIVAVTHQPAMSTSDAQGSDLGIRQNWMPLFYKYGVDFVLAGHDHDYERSYVVHGTDSGTILRPRVVSTELTNVNSDLGLVHLVIGTGGTKGHDDAYETGTAGEPEESINVSGTEIETEDAPWSAVTDPDITHPVGNRRLRRGPWWLPRRQDHDDLHLLPHSGRYGFEPLPGPCRVRHVHRYPHPLGRLRLPPAQRQVGLPVSGRRPSVRATPPPARRRCPHRAGRCPVSGSRRGCRRRCRGPAAG